MPFYLAPRFWGVHLLAAVLVATATLLGSWQLGAWQQRREAAATDLTRVAPIPLATALGPDDPFPGDRIGQPVEVEGRWVPDGTVLVSGREQDGRSGFWVVTPLAVDLPGDPAIPVVRGWTPSGDQAPPPPEGTTALIGWLQPPEGTGEADPDPTDDVLPQLRIADLVQHVDQDLYGAYVVDVAVDPHTDGLEQATLEQLPDAGRFTALRNLLYALEWWVFGGFAVFIWWRHLQDTRAAEAAVDPVPSET